MTPLTQPCCPLPAPPEQARPLPLSGRSNPAPELGPRLAWLRRQRRLSQSALAAQVGISASRLCKIESGAMSPSVDLLQRLLQELACSLRRLLSMPEAAASHSWRALDRADPRVAHQPLARDLARKAMGPQIVRLRAGDRLQSLPDGELFLLVLRGDIQWLHPGESPQRLRSGDSLYLKSGAPGQIAAGPDGCELVLVAHR